LPVRYEMNRRRPRALRKEGRGAVKGVGSVHWSRQSRPSGLVSRAAPQSQPTDAATRPPTHLRPLFRSHRIDRDDIPIPSPSTPHIPGPTCRRRRHSSCSRLVGSDHTTPRGRLAQIMVLSAAEMVVVVLMSGQGTGSGRPVEGRLAGTRSGSGGVHVA